MPTTIDKETLVHDRVTMLAAIGKGMGLRRIPTLDEHQQQLFSLESSDPMELADKLSSMREFLTWSDDLQAAYYAIGVDADSADDKRRRGALFMHRGATGDLLDHMHLNKQEMQGFTALATAYDLVMKLQKAISNLRAGGDNKALEAFDEAFDTQVVEA